jgi:hypothetical protein
MIGVTSRSSGTAYSSGDIGWIDSEDQPGRVGGTGPTSASQDGSGLYDGGTGQPTHRGYASSKSQVTVGGHCAGTGTTRKGCRDGCRCKEDDSGSGTRRRRAVRLPGIGFTRAVSRGEVEATARVLLEVGGLQERVTDANDDASAVWRWSAEYACAPCGRPLVRCSAAGGARQAGQVGREGHGCGSRMGQTSSMGTAVGAAVMSPGWRRAAGSGGDGDTASASTCGRGIRVAGSASTCAAVGWLDQVSGMDG